MCPRPLALARAGLAALALVLVVPAAAAAGSLSDPSEVVVPEAASAAPAAAAGDDDAPPADDAAPAADAPPTPAPAGDSEDDGPAVAVAEDMVVTADRMAVPAETTGSSVTVIGRGEIELRQPISLLELLRTVPGLEVAQSGGPGGVASVFIRGGGSDDTLVLLDGVRLNSPTSGAFDFADLTTDAIERIEILRGPQSGLYGSEAMGGVVSITTRRGEGAPGGWVAAESGSRAHRRLAAGAGGARGGFDFAVTAAAFETDGVSAASERRGNRENDPYDNMTLAARLGVGFLGDGRADLTLRYVDSQVAIDGFTFGVGPTDDPNALQNREMFQASLRLQKELAPWWHQSVTVGTVDDETIGSDPDTPFNNFRFRGRVSEASAVSDFRLGADDHLLAGASFERREAANPGAFDEGVDLASVFLTNRWGWRDRLFVSVGARHDDYSELGAETTWRTTASLLFPGRGTRLHASTGTGFRLPTFNELFFPGAGNPGLSPEASRGWDAGVEQGFLDGRVRLGATWFENRFDDLITFDLASFRFANVARAESRGVELSLDAAVRPGLDLGSSWTWTETEDLATGLPLARRPEHRGTLVVAYQPRERLRGTLAAVVVRDRIDSDGTAMDDYERFDLTAEYRLGVGGSPAGPWHLRLYVRIDNLLGAGYEEISGFTTPGRTAVVGVKLGSPPS